MSKDKRVMNDDQRPCLSCGFITLQDTEYGWKCAHCGEALYTHAALERILTAKCVDCGFKLGTAMRTKIERIGDLTMIIRAFDDLANRIGKGFDKQVLVIARIRELVKKAKLEE